MRDRLPSPAMIVALIALVVATTGTGYAAMNLPKKSVGTKQLKPNSVTGAKVKNRTLTGKDINLAKLGTVPDAAHANVADSATTANTANSAKTAEVANALPPVEPTHLVGTPGEPQFEFGATNYSELGEFQAQPVGFYKDREGIVHLEGVAKLAEDGAIFTLPPGYRPARGKIIVFERLDDGLTLIAGTGTLSEGDPIDGMVIASEEAAQEKLYSLEGISFRAGS